MLFDFLRDRQVAGGRNEDPGEGVEVGRIVRACGDVDDVHVFLGHLGELADVVYGDAAFDVLIAADAELHDEVGADGISDSFADAQREAGPVLDGSAVFVRAVVGQRGEVLSQEPAVRSVDLYHLETAVLHEQSGFGKVVAALLHESFIHAADVDSVLADVVVRTYGVSAFKEFGVGGCARVVDLHRGDGSVAVDQVSFLDPLGVAHLIGCKYGDVALVVLSCRVFEVYAGLGYRDGSCSAHGLALEVEHLHGIGGVAVAADGHRARSREYPVAVSDVPYCDRIKQIRVFIHKHPPCNTWQKTMSELTVPACAYTFYDN